jgi:hypothetical protein
MNSKLFSAVDLSNNKEDVEFNRDIVNLAEVTEDALDVIYKYFPEMTFATTNKHIDALSEKVADATGLPLIRVSSIYQCLIFFYRRIRGGKYMGDTTEAWARDIAQFGIIDQNQEKLLSRNLKPLLDISEELESEALRRDFANGVFPTLSGFGSTTELRSVQKDRYDTTIDVNNYRPDIKDTLPVASIRLKFKNTSKQDVYFQADKSDVDFLIAHLRALLKDMSALESFVKK